MRNTIRNFFDYQTKTRSMSWIQHSGWAAIASELQLVTVLAIYFAADCPNCNDSPAPHPCADGLPRPVTWRNRQTMVQLRLPKLSLQVRPTFAILSISESGIFSKKPNVRFVSVGQLFRFSISFRLSITCVRALTFCYSKLAQTL